MILFIIIIAFMESEQWMSRAKDNHNETQQLTGWVNDGIQSIEHQTSQIGHQRCRLREDIAQLKLKIKSVLLEPMELESSGIEAEIDRLTQLKQSNSIEIQNLHGQIQLLRKQSRQYRQIVSSDKRLAQQFDQHIGTYTKLHLISRKLQHKSKLMSILLSTIRESNL